MPRSVMPFVRSLMYQFHADGLDEDPQNCQCEASCQPHRHDHGKVLCLHNGETEHDHCPQARPPAAGGGTRVGA